MTAVPTRADADRLDAADPLAPFRNRFAIDDELVYLDGNSLGRPPRAAVAAVAQALEKEWGERLIRAWYEGWMELPTAVGDLIGGLIGAAPGQVIVADSTTVCFYKLAAAALSLRPDRREIVTDHGNFPTDRYVLESLARERDLTIRWLEPADPVAGPSPAELETMLSPRTALVTFTHVDYRSAAILDMAQMTRAAHDCGALALWDLSHTVGLLPVDLDAWGVDLAVGCTYKYLNGGPGAPAFAYVNASHLERLDHPIWGWIGRRDRFAMGAGYEPAPGIERLLSGTPSVLALAAVRAGVELVLEAGVDAIRAKAAALTELARELSEAWLPSLGVRVFSPREPSRRGGHVALAHPDAAVLCERLAEHDVIVDFRMPDLLRLGLSPLTTRYVDVWDGVARLRELLTAQVP
jgi:kynureninase